VIEASTGAPSPLPLSGQIHEDWFNASEAPSWASALVGSGSLQMYQVTVSSGFALVLGV